MGDPMNMTYPHTCHLLEVLEYLQVRGEFHTQKLLFELISNYISYTGSYEYMNECHYKLVEF